MLEIEAKFRLANAVFLEAQLLSIGAIQVADHQEIDHYLNGPDRDFARTDEAFRLRSIGEENFLTYKGPRVDATSKTRTELEVPCPSGGETAEAFLRLFGLLGYRATAIVRKNRRIYEWQRDGFRVHACLDDVENVGGFVELEILAESSQYQVAHDLIFRIAREMELGQTETRSYLEQLLKHTVPPGGEAFEPK